MKPFDRRSLRGDRVRGRCRDAAAGRTGSEPGGHRRRYRARAGPSRRRTARRRRERASRVLLQGATPSDQGVWLPVEDAGRSHQALDQLPILPWAAVFADRQLNELEPHTRCKPSGVAREFQTPCGVEFVELPEQQKIYIFDIGGPHLQDHLHGWALASGECPAHRMATPSGGGRATRSSPTRPTSTKASGSIARSARERLHTIERWTRKDYSTMEYSLTVDDPGAYSARWTTSVILTWEPNTELFEYVCQQQNYAHELMVGEMKSVDRRRWSRNAECRMRGSLHSF